MPDTSPPPSSPPPAAADGLRVVLFGMPAAGKSSLLGALSQAAQLQQHLLNGRLKDLTHGLDELRERLYHESPRRTAEEVVPYPVDYEPFAPGDGAPAPPGHLQAIFVDCDGRVANDLLVRNKALDENSPEGTLARSVLDADTLVLVIDASAPAAQIEADFAEFGRFLRLLERTRGRRTEVGGLPVFLVLTKCDLLAKPADSALDWMEHIEQRKREVDAQFRDFLERTKRSEGTLPFGRIDLHLWATAVKRPALQGAPAKATEPFGVAELFRQCLEQAEAFRERRQRSGRRLFWTVGASAGIASLLLASALGLVFLHQDVPPSPLQVKIEIYKAVEPPTVEERLHGGPEVLRRKFLDKLRDFESDPTFAALPPDLRDYVTGREKELEEYLALLEKIQAVRRPGEATGEEALGEIARSLGELKSHLPAEWSRTEAARRIDERFQETEALQKAAARVKNWYLDNADRGRDLWTFAGSLSGPESPRINWRTWQADADRLLDPARAPPFTETEHVPGAPNLSYATVLRFDQVVKARADWEATRQKLDRLRNVSAALGLGGPARDDRPAALVIPRPPGFPLARAADRLEELKRSYPRYQTEFVLSGLPDAAVPDVRQAAQTNYEFLLEPAREQVLRQLQQAGSGAEETPARWAAVRTWLKDPLELASWRVLALVLARLGDPGAVDPVNALESFLQQSSFALDIQRLTLEVPESLKVRPALGAALWVYHVPTSPEKPALVFESAGEPRTDDARRVVQYRFRLVEGRRLTYHPGDELWATLPVRDDQALTWARSRSAVYQFERLVRPPRLHKVNQPNTEGTLAEGVQLIVYPPDGVPTVPDLMPVVRLEGR